MPKLTIAENQLAQEAIRELKGFSVGDIVEHRFPEIEVGLQQGTITGIRLQVAMRGLYMDHYEPSIEVTFHDGAVYDEFRPMDLNIVRKVT